MKQKSLVLLSLFTVTLFVSTSLFGAGPRGGGGGSYRGGSSPNRTPSMSRSSPSSSFNHAPAAEAAHRENQSKYIQNPATRNDLNKALQNTHPTASNLNLSGQNLSNLPRNNINPTGQNLSNLNNAIPGNMQQALNHNYPNYGNWFGNGSNWNGYHFPYATTGNMWNGAAWGAAAGWLGSSWANNPYYYDGSNYQEVPYTPPAAVTNVYTEPTAVASAPTGGPQDALLPLGVFTIGKDEAAVTTQANLFLQLAMDKTGAIAGTFYNALTNQSYPLDGIVDLNTQMVVIKLTNHSAAPILQTGLYNLTQSQTNVTLNFPDGSQQTWLMVRVQPPTGG